ncbi:cupin domain-containing protein [Kordiimonas aquimaris]|uniref:cupin domain-containing protein n=1 Tax=Kordiimonas aquimaris TaxID=707591 RepID=UPI0021D3BE68|nr:cupin domain-containing protein [Kordiimonas aquimaris]
MNEKLNNWASDLVPKYLWGVIDRKIAKNNKVFPNGIEAVYREKGDWWPLTAGVMVKSLYIDNDTQTESFLMKFTPGSSVETHSHDGFTEECMVMEGDIILGDIRFAPGDFHVAKPDSTHPSLWSEKGGVLFVRSKRVTGMTEPYSCEGKT